MTGKASIDLAVQSLHFATELFKQLGSHLAGSAIARVDDNLEGHRDCDILQHLLHIGGRDVLAGHASVARAEFTGNHPIANLLNAACRDGLLIQNDFQPILIGRVVAARDHDAGPAVQMPRGKIQQGRGHQSDIDNIPAGFQQGTDQRRFDAGAGCSAIAAHDQDLFTHFSSDCANRPGDICHQFIGQFRLGIAANIVGAKDMLGKGLFPAGGSFGSVAVASKPGPVLLHPRPAYF